MASEREQLVDAFTRVKIALECPALDWMERAVLQMEYIQGWGESEICDTLRLKPREWRKMRGEALDKACVMPKPKTPTKIEVVYEPENNA